MTAAEFRQRANVLVSDLAAAHERALVLADSKIAGMASDEMVAAAGAILAALHIIETTVERYPADTEVAS